MGKSKIGGMDTLSQWPPVQEMRGKSGKVYRSTSIFCLYPGHEPRRTAIRFVESKPFDPFILLTILANCSSMAWQSPLDPTGTHKEEYAAAPRSRRRRPLRHRRTHAALRVVGIGHAPAVALRPVRLSSRVCLASACASLVGLPLIHRGDGGSPLVCALCACCVCAVCSLPCARAPRSIINVLEWVFLAIFTTEMCVKILAYGFLMHKGAYLRDAWCQLDFVVVTLAWLPIIFPQMGNYSVLRAFRALRPLRALKRVPGMPVLVQWILSVMPKFGNVAMLCGFVFLVFAIVGMELFKGALHYRCARPGFVETAGHPINDVRRMLKGGGGVDAPSLTAQDEWDTGVACHLDSTFGQCPEGLQCMYFDVNPSHGINSFDSVAMVFIAFIQAVT